MTIVKNKQLIEHIFEYDVVLFGMGINNAMNKGFSYDIAINFPEVKENEDSTGYGDTRKYGKIHITSINQKLDVCACYCYNIGLKKNNNGVFVDYNALETCLETVSRDFRGKRIASPIIGQDEYDGNGDKEKIIAIYKKIFQNYDITLYDFIQQDFRRERYKEAVTIRKKYSDGEITKDEFKHLKKLNEWKRLTGIYKPMPDDFEYKPRKKSLNKIPINKKKK